MLLFLFRCCAVNQSYYQHINFQSIFNQFSIYFQSIFKQFSINFPVSPCTVRSSSTVAVLSRILPVSSFPVIACYVPGKLCSRHINYCCFNPLHVNRSCLSCTTFFKNSGLKRFPSLPLPGSTNPLKKLIEKSVVFQLYLICVVRRRYDWHIFCSLNFYCRKSAIMATLIVR